VGRTGALFDVDRAGNIAEKWFLKVSALDRLRN
jgi:hypothetical protein